jgi:hypothetical protein
VHYTPKGYNLAAAGLEALIYEKRGEEREAEEKAEKQPAKKARFDLTKKRPDWVKGSVSEAVRSSDGGQQRLSGNWRGNKLLRGVGQPVWRGGGSGGAFGGRDSGGRERAAPRGRGGDRGRATGAAAEAAHGEMEQGDNRLCKKKKQ